MRPDPEMLREAAGRAVVFAPEPEMPVEITPEPEMPVEMRPDPEMPREAVGRAVVFAPEPEIPVEIKPEPEMPVEMRPDPEMPREAAGRAVVFAPEPEMPVEIKPEPEMPVEMRPDPEMPSWETGCALSLKAVAKVASSARTGEFEEGLIPVTCIKSPGLGDSSGWIERTFEKSTDVFPTCINAIDGRTQFTIAVITTIDAPGTYGSFVFIRTDVMGPLNCVLNV
jgi:hypothetical protein